VSDVKRVLIVGSGVAGLALGIGLLQKGIRADIVELKLDNSVPGLGIALLGPTLRALQIFDLLERCIAQGFAYSSFVVRRPDGEVVRTVDLPSLLGHGRPSAIGIMRPIFHRILADACSEAGVTIRFNITVSAIAARGDAVDVIFTDGSQDIFDLVVGADGAYSKIRSLLWEDDPKPRLTGQSVWRATVPRPAEVTALNIYYGGPNQPGFNPVSQEEMYVFLVENTPDNPRRPEHLLPQLLREQLAPYEGLLARSRECITSPEQIVYRPIEAMLLPTPWNKGRVVLIGDAAHVPTPHLASGAGLAIEDAIVLSELLASDALADVALQRFAERRFDRCRMVVDNSVQIGAWELAPHSPGADPAGLLDRSMAALAQPI
jgi:2-polyprenyl-6-methoxyphenol hydroxylase-like FAD-dependent oxidoreductase